MDNLKLVKFETFVGDINYEIKRVLSAYFSQGKFSALSLVYDRRKYEGYAKSIMEKAQLIFSKGLNNPLRDDWAYERDEDAMYEDAQKMIDAAKDLVRLCKLPYNEDEKYKFIFWALMVLTVDKTDAEEHLSQICDFAQMLQITDDEFEDILQVIKRIYGEADRGYAFKSKIVQRIFVRVLDKYKAEEAN